MRITKRFEFDMGHRLQGHESKCRNVHGHRFVFEVTVEGYVLDGVGRVIDFSVLKRDIGGWLDETFDHAFAAERGDPIIEWLVAHGQKHVVLDTPPTIEHLVALVFAEASRRVKHHGIKVVHVRGYETPTSWADFS